MKRLPVFLSLVLVLCLLLAGCAPGEEEPQTPGVTATQDLTAVPGTTEPGLTEPAGTVPAGTEPAATEAMETPTLAGTEPAATETLAVTETPGATGTEVLPPTGAVDPGRLSVLRTYEVCSQDGRMIGDVHDFIIDLDNLEIDYVIVSTSRFEEVGRRVAVRWSDLEVRPGNDDGRSETCEEVFVLLVSQDVFANAPEFSLNTFPEIGEQAAGWDADLTAYWESGGTAAAGTPVAGAATATVTTEQATATPTAEAGQATGTPAAGEATATPGAEATPAATQPAGESGRVLGVVLAREIIGIRLVGDTGQSMGVVRDILADITSGKALYVVVEIRTAAGEARVLAVPLQALRWDPNALMFGFVVDQATLEAAPSFEGNAIPDTQASGWDAEILTYWSGLLEGLGQE